MFFIILVALVIGFLIGAITIIDITIRCSEEKWIRLVKAYMRARQELGTSNYSTRKEEPHEKE